MSTSNPPPSSRFAPFYTILNAAPKETWLVISPLFGSVPNYDKLYDACGIKRGSLIGIMLEIGLVNLRYDRYEVQRDILMQMAFECQGFQHTTMRLNINQKKSIVNIIFIDKNVNQHKNPLSLIEWDERPHPPVKN